MRLPYFVHQSGKGERYAMGSDGIEEEEDQYDLFESSIESLFDHHQVATGKPGGRLRFTFEYGQDATKIECRIPTNKDASNNRLFAHYQWDAGIFLATKLHNGDLGISIAGKSVVELGAGTGLPSLVCARKGASNVCITDYPDKGILEAIAENITINKMTANASAFGLDWYDSKQINSVLHRSPGSNGYDLILCADVLWLSSSHDALITTMQGLLAKKSDSRVIILSGFHTGRRALTAFFLRACKVGLVCDWEDHDDSVRELNVVSGEVRAWTGSSRFPRDAAITETVGEEMNGVDNMDDYSERTKWLLYVSLRWASSRLPEKH